MPQALDFQAQLELLLLALLILDDLMEVEYSLRVKH
jgi:hypothetical protein